MRRKSAPGREQSVPPSQLTSQYRKGQLRAVACLDPEPARKPSNDSAALKGTLRAARSFRDSKATMPCQRSTWRERQPCALVASSRLEGNLKFGGNPPVLIKWKPSCLAQCVEDSGIPFRFIARCDHPEVGDLSARSCRHFDHTNRVSSHRTGEHDVSLNCSTQCSRIARHASAMPSRIWFGGLRRFKPKDNRNVQGAWHQMAGCSPCWRYTECFTCFKRGCIQSSIS